MNLHSVDPDALLLLHHESMVDMGVGRATHDARRLDAALAYPLQRAITGDSDIAAIAAAYAIGILSYQPFSAGNINAACLAMKLFLSSNGWELMPSRLGITQVVQGVVTGEMNEAQLANWLRQHL